MSEQMADGEVSEDIKKEMIAIQDAVSPSFLGTPIEETVASMEKHLLPQYRTNLFGAIYNYEEGIAAVRAGSLKMHTSTRHDLSFFCAGDTYICFGFADGVDYLENGEKAEEHLNLPFCDIFVRVDGRLRLLAVTASAVKEEPLDTA